MDDLGGKNTIFGNTQMVFLPSTITTKKPSVPPTFHDVRYQHTELGSSLRATRQGICCQPDPSGRFLVATATWEFFMEKKRAQNGWLLRLYFGGVTSYPFVLGFLDIPL